MKNQYFATFSILVLVIILLSVYSSWIKHKLNDSENFITSLTEKVQKDEETFTILNEMNDRQNRVICEYQKEMKRLKNEQTKKISIIEESKDACDWLDSPVPDSIGMLFGTTGNERSCPDEASLRVTDAM